MEQDQKRIKGKDPAQDCEKNIDQKNSDRPGSVRQKTDGELYSNRNSDIGGVRIRNLNYIFIVCLGILTVCLLVISILLSNEYEEGTQITDEYHRIEQDARMVQAASDYLTRSVQLFVLTGNRVYLDDYFKEANETKRRENAIEDLEKMQATDSLIMLLENSVRESMDLMQLEYVGMRYAAEGYGMDITSLPEVIQDTELPEEALNMTDEEKIEQARNIEFGSEYYKYKDRISGYESQYLEEAIALMDELQKEGRKDMQRLLLLQRIAVLVIAALGIMLFVAISRMIVHPLRHAVNSIAGGERIYPINGTYEIQYMSKIYNGFRKDSVELQEQLKMDAERDVLTGVLNRRGYHTVIDRLSLETFPMAMLIMDVDDFKRVNDTYGHAMGDEALKRVARVLLDEFRGTDITSRIGGDEFAVIMSNVTSKHKDIIGRKIENINTILQTPGENGCPPLSVSVGCAFSSSGYTNLMFTEADSRMYDAKNAGGGRIWFA